MTQKASELGRFIRLERARSDMTSKTLAGCMGVSTTFLSAVETGQRSLPPRRLVAMAHILDMSEGAAQELAWLAAKQAVEVER